MSPSLDRWCIFGHGAIDAVKAATRGMATGQDGVKDFFSSEFTLAELPIQMTKIVVQVKDPLSTFQ